ncbi:PAS/PAC sensor hybrid histidine kinase [Halenospora varia]|nr:PAS/PAC sensor hybrid histidine kinase [Halenospora varia]
MDTAEEALRKLEPHWNHGMIAASIAISLLGAFTSTQLMCQARVSLRFSSVLIWTLLGSLTFGFCAIWSLHFVAMLAYELDLQIGINVPCTVLSAVLAVLFTFAALGSDLLWETYQRERQGKHWPLRRRQAAKGPRTREREITRDNGTRPLLRYSEEDGEYTPPVENAELTGFDLSPGSRMETDESPLLDVEAHPESSVPEQMAFRNDPARKPLAFQSDEPTLFPRISEQPEHTFPDRADSTAGLTESSKHSVSRRSSSLLGSNSSYGLSSIRNLAYRSTSPAKNAFLATGEALYAGCTRKNITKGFLWSLAITTMHYTGLLALTIPQGYCTLNYWLVTLSGMISWLVCVVGCILMPQMESHLGRQFLFSAVATTGVAAMHFTGMRATTFWSESPPSEERGYPFALAIAIVSIAITTCIAANGLLAHDATVSRNKLAEIVWTRRKLWRTIAKKENAEAAAAARSDFIASASHEIRTPLHHLQGYSDLLSQTELTEEGRLLLLAIQRATKTLLLITNNVLDWSKLERDAETICQPIALDMRTVCESILILLPNKDDEAEVELMVVVKPNVPHSIFLDETYIHRILMNLLSNALKFTRSGYILLLIEIENGKVVATVKDTGSGVPHSFLPQLFEPFKQAQTRGSQRGTGLGLSIVKQLLHKMDGNIRVESKHPETGEIEPGQSGSTFTISVPIPTSTVNPEPIVAPIPKVAIFHGGNERSIEGLQIAWENFGYEAVMVKEFDHLSGVEWKYIWADLPFLKKNVACLQELISQDKWLVLIPYDTQNTIHQVPEIVSASNFIPLPRPLSWHSFAQRIAAASQEPGKSEISRAVRFASKVDIVDRSYREQAQGLTAKNLVILLVEDNSINQKLGKKMLTSLGYEVQIADNGQEAIEQLMKDDANIDAILMDQSMPLKDGVTATREIREMEASGMVLTRRPIIAVTAVVSTQAQALFKAAGADDFLAKPLSLLKLEQTLAAHLPAKWR